jgi:hypothetical protein
MQELQVEDCSLPDLVDVVVVELGCPGQSRGVGAASSL